MLKPAQAHGYCDWIYAQQEPEGGFRGSDSLEGAVPGSGSPPPAAAATPAAGAPVQGGGVAAAPGELGLAPANVIQSYTALLSLAILGDGFERLDRAGLVAFVGRCQNADGS